jgi:hypothetical protein
MKFTLQLNPVIKKSGLLLASHYEKINWPECFQLADLKFKPQFYFFDTKDAYEFGTLFQNLNVKIIEIDVLNTIESDWHFSKEIRPLIPKLSTSIPIPRLVQLVKKGLQLTYSTEKPETESDINEMPAW